MSDTYIGIVVRDGTQDVQVYVPEIDGPVAFGASKTIGTGAGNAWGAMELAQMRKKARYAKVVSSDISSGGLANYNEETGQSTIQDCYRAKGKESDLSKQIDAPTPYHAADEGRSWMSKATNCSSNFFSTYLLDDTKGTKLDRNPNKPKGTFSKLRVGQRVLVQTYNNGTKMMIIGNAPWDGEADSNILLK